MSLVFEWDSAKAEVNSRKHGIAFDEAVTVFGDPLSLTVGDVLHSASERRFIIMGRSQQRRILVVVHTERGERIRIISARRATKRERRQYEETQTGDRSF